MATGKTLKLREIKVTKKYPEKVGELRIFEDGSMYRVNRGRGWRFVGVRTKPND